MENRDEGRQMGCQKFLEIQQHLLARERIYEGFGYDIRKDREWILEAAEPLSGEILEAGTGKGYFALALARKGYSFTTFDISEEAQEISRLHLSHHGLDSFPRFVIENGEALSFKEGSFDTVLSVNTLHHLEKPFKVIEELMRVLKPLGKLVLCDFSEKGFLMMEKIHADEGHVHERGFISLSEVGGLLEKKGFTVHKKNSVFQEVLIAEKKT